MRELKVESELFSSIAESYISYESIKKDENFEINDIVEIKEVEGEVLTGREVIRKISNIFENGACYSMEEGYVLLELIEI